MTAAKKTCIVYARTSADDAEDVGKDGAAKTSITDQLKAGRELAARNGYTVAAEITDADRSGRTWWTGAELAKHDRAYLRYCEEHIPTAKRRTRDGLAQVVKMLPKIDVIIVRELDRLMRPLPTGLMSGEVMELLRANGVIIVTPAKTYSPDDFADALIMSVDALVQDKSIKARVAECKVALSAKRDSGYLTHGKAPYGYHSAGRQKVTRVPRQIEIARDIFKRYLDGATIQEIARHLNATKAPVVEKGIWKSQNVRRMLLNPLYAAHQLNTRGELIPSIPYRGLEVVSLTEWRQVQQRMAKNARFDKTKCTPRPFAGLLYCGVCGERLYSHTGRSKYESYRCLRGVYHDKGSTEAECRKVAITESERALYSGKESRAGGLMYSLMPLVVRLGLLRRKSATNDAETIAKQLDLQEKIGDLDKRSKVLAQSFATGDLDAESYQSATKTIKERRKALQQELDSVEATANAGASGVKMPVTMDALTPIQKQELCRETFKRITVYADHVTITLWNGDSFDLERVKVRCARGMPIATVNKPPETTYTKTTAQDFVDFKYRSAYDDPKAEARTLHFVAGSDKTQAVVIRAIGHN